MMVLAPYAEGAAHGFVDVPPEALEEIEEPACKDMLRRMRRYGGGGGGVVSIDWMGGLGTDQSAGRDICLNTRSNPILATRHNPTNKPTAGMSPSPRPSAPQAP